tara:strand:+ start:101 stop:457 length:357 start_codon:yes stop_codon:yes gene_type:complete
MNKDLPPKVANIFSNLDPNIWSGIWLDILNNLLSSPSMPSVWENIILQAMKNKTNYPSLGESQFIKWELKAFVAQTVNLVNKNYNKEEFILEFEKYFCIKGYKINKDIIIKVYESIYN